MQELLSAETLAPTEGWLCPVCGHCVTATKRTVIHKPPKVLILHLKRFCSDNGMQTKITTNVSYPSELDISEFSEESVGKYRLIGVVMHTGTIAFGHYTAAAIDPISGRWYSFNDSCVAVASEQSVRSSRAYVLLYQEGGIIGG
jgi:ubiquitin C-terminal hydrolase